MLQDAVKNYRIPLVRYDLPIPTHPWSFQAHVDARFFDTKTKELGEEFRRWIFANQSSITKLNMRAMVERIAPSTTSAFRLSSIPMASWPLRTA